MTTGEAPIAIHTLEEAAAILRVKPSWLERQAAARRIPFTMLGGSYRFTAEHLAAIVRQYEKRPVAAIQDDSGHPTAQRTMSGRLSGNTKMTSLRPRPRRAA